MHDPSINQIDSIIKRESEQKAAKKMMAKHKHEERKLKPYKADFKTTFYCSSPEKGAQAISEYKKRMKLIN